MLGSPRSNRTVTCTGTRGERRSLRTWGGPECGDFFRPAPRPCASSRRSQSKGELLHFGDFDCSRDCRIENMTLNRFLPARLAYSVWAEPAR